MTPEQRHRAEKIEELLALGYRVSDEDSQLAARCIGAVLEASREENWRTREDNSYVKFRGLRNEEEHHGYFQRAIAGDRP